MIYVLQNLLTQAQREILLARLERWRSNLKAGVSCRKLASTPCYARSNRNFNITPPGKPRPFGYFLCARRGQFDGEAFLGWGMLTFHWVGSGKIEPEDKVSNYFSWRLTAIDACLEEIKE